MKKNLTNKDYNYVRKDISEWYGINPTVPQLKKMLKDKPEILVEIASQPGLSSGLDTVVRESVAEVFAQKLVGKAWPDGIVGMKKSNEFFKTLVKNCKKAKIQVNVDEEYLN